MSLATKYRPLKFEDVCDQNTIIKILKRQLELQTYSNCYLFTGPSGCGKTTLARIFANKINNGIGMPIEIDGASNNGVDNVRNIITEATERSIESEYKIYIIDECHLITLAGWNAFLKCIEEPPVHTIFIFCTTNPEKIPETIMNRVMVFNLTKIKTDHIKTRLLQICNAENFINYTEACEYIAKVSNGGMRDAIAMLEKCSNYDTDLSITNVLDCLGGITYDTLFSLTNACIDRNDRVVINIIETLYDKGLDLKLFVDQYIDFILDLTKYCHFKDMTLLRVPASFENDVKYATSFGEAGENKAYFSKVLTQLLNLKLNLRLDNNSKSTVEITLINICRGI